MVVVRSSAAVDDRGANGGRVMVNGANKDVTTPRRVTSSSSLSSAAAAINYPDNQQVFVGNLPQHLTDQDLIDFFDREFFSSAIIDLTNTLHVLLRPGKFWTRATMDRGTLLR